MIKMDKIYDNKTKYINVLNRIQRKISSYEPLFIMKKQYLTNNTTYYFLCILFRFISILSFCGDYNDYSLKYKKTPPLKKYLNILTCYNLLSKFNISFATYVSINFIIFILFLFRLNRLIFVLKKFHEQNSIKSNDYHLPCNYQIIIEHVIFLFFPYIIEYLSFIYHIYFFPNKFFIKPKNQNILLILILIIINSFLIFAYNIENYVTIICSNKAFTITIFDAFSNIKSKNVINKKPIEYKYSNIFIFLYIFLQNFVMILSIRIHIKSKKYNFYFNIIASLILLLCISLCLLSEMNTFNYINFINIFFNILLLYALYSLIFGLIIYLTGYELKKILSEIIYILFKLFCSYISYISMIMKLYSYLEL